MAHTAPCPFVRLPTPHLSYTGCCSGLNYTHPAFHVFAWNTLSTPPCLVNSDTASEIQFKRLYPVRHFLISTEKLQAQSPYLATCMAHTCLRHLPRVVHPWVTRVCLAPCVTISSRTRTQSYSSKYPKLLGDNWTTDASACAGYSQNQVPLSRFSEKFGPPTSIFHSDPANINLAS